MQYAIARFVYFHLTDRDRTFRRTFPFPLDLRLSLIYIHCMFTFDGICHKHFSSTFSFFSFSSTSWAMSFIRKTVINCFILVAISRAGIDVNDHRWWQYIRLHDGAVGSGSRKIMSRHFQELDIRAWFATLWFLFTSSNLTGSLSHFYGFDKTVSTIIFVKKDKFVMTNLYSLACFS